MTNRTAHQAQLDSVAHFSAKQHEKRVREFAEELRKWWSFDDGQRHTHSWHSREDFIERKLPELLRR